MARKWHSASMSIVIVFGILLAACLLNLIVEDRRDLDDKDRRGWWPGSPRR
jgi:hypothetical protein